MPSLKDKTCLITGGARGIGAAIARAFAKAGGQIIIADLREAEGQATADAVHGRFIAMDVANEGAWDQLHQDAPRIDVLVNNAGVTGFESGAVAHDPENASLDAWRAVHRVNLDGVFLGCRYAIRAMRPKGCGAIVNLSSRSGMVGVPAAAAYASSKAAVRNHTKTVALYCAQQGLDIRCNSIHPAAVLTPMWEPMLGDGPDRDARMAELVADTPMKRFGRPEEVAALALLLASDDAGYVTGAEFTIDGGLLAGSAASP